MSLIHVLRRLGLLVVVIWTAMTLNFILPRITGRNPVIEKLMDSADSGGANEYDFDRFVNAMNARFGFDRPLWQQYLDYMGDLLRFDLGYSIANFPTRVSDLIASALPWTIGLMLTATLIAFAIGSVLGALTAWFRSSKLLNLFVPVVMVLAALPFYLIGLVLIYAFAFELGWFPSSGAFVETRVSREGWDYYLEILHHAVLPGLSIVLASTGTWALSMRGMMVTVQGEDYMTFADAKGLAPKRMFFRYGVRNAILPQITMLALFMGQIITGAVLVEIVFSYPGIGFLLLRSIQINDFTTIYGIVFILILTIGVSMLIVDLLYPILDPRTRKTHS
ncbi:MAG: ABC transporter permease [Pseudomonadota bacterium]